MDDKQLLRYSRHILLPQVDIKGQEAISAGRGVDYRNRWFGFAGFHVSCSFWCGDFGAGR